MRLPSSFGSPLTATIAAISPLTASVAAIFCPTATIAAILCLLAPPVSAQSLPVGDAGERYLRLLQLTGGVAPGSFTVRPVSAETAAAVLRHALGGPDTHAEAADSTTRAPSQMGPGAHPWEGRLGVGPHSSFRDGAWSVGDSRLRVFANTKHPRGWNDGVVWQGRGLTTALDSEARLRWRGLSLTLNPTLLFNQNASIPLAPVPASGQPIYAYPWRRMDYPQRFGPEAFWTFDPGQSQIALDWKGARVAFGNENLWWGPGIRNAIVMSNNAPGFLHTSLATNRPVDIGIGELEGRWIWGGLDQSDWFDPSAPSDRFITGIVLAYSPSFLEGLTVGGTRVFQEYVPDSGLDFEEYFLVLQGLVKAGQVSEESPDGTDERDQLLSLFARWVFPESGAEVYVEWARTDHAGDLYDLLLEPEHSQGYTLGIQKVTSRTEDRIFVLSAELTHLEASATFQLRPRPTYYEHSVVTQGYTHKGQVLGAWVGPGGNSQYVGFEMFERWGSAKLFAQRQVHDNDAYYEYALATDGRFDNHHVSFDVGVDALVFRGDFELGGGVIWTRELNRWFFGPKSNNFNLSFSARWRPGAG